jgi:NADP-dependent 3-hydroxy acid dehydrogenase YdfG
MKIPLVKTVLVTGATSGIGKATATIFAKNGYNVIITGRRKERLNELKEKLTRKYGVEILALNFDIRDHQAVKKAWKSMKGNWKNIDVLVNNAGLAKGLSPIHEGDTEHWETMIDTNIKGLLYITRLVTPGMVERKSGFVINVCSSAGHEVYPKGNVYSATKFAVDALTRSMRLDLYTHGIRVGQVSPGHVEETEFALVRFDGDASRASIYQDFKPLRSKDVADAIYYMASRPKHVNIQDIHMFSTQQAGSNFIDRSGRTDI